MIKAAVRKPVVAGTFYRSDAAALKEQLSGFFRNVKSASSCMGVVSPHAGYDYSGQSAAWAIASLKSAKTFIILGPNHNTLGEQFSCLSSGSWETPLGKVRVNPGIAKLLLQACPFLAEDSAAHVMEHSIEVQLPFLQYKFKSFDFVPISIMNIDYGRELLDKCEKLGKAIAMLARNRGMGIIASSDFSHYLPKEMADEKDGKAMERIMGLDAGGFFKTLEDTGASVCGYGPVAVLMSAAKALGLKAKPIHNSTSGDTTGDFSSVVAYYAIGFE